MCRHMGRFSESGMRGAGAGSHREFQNHLHLAPPHGRTRKSGEQFSGTCDATNQLATGPGVYATPALSRTWTAPCLSEPLVTRPAPPADSANPLPLPKPLRPKGCSSSTSTTAAAAPYKWPPSAAALRYQSPIPYTLSHATQRN
jgi:hypothetical protein